MSADFGRMAERMARDKNYPSDAEWYGLIELLGGHPYQARLVENLREMLLWLREQSGVFSPANTQDTQFSQPSPKNLQLNTENS